MRVTKTLFTFLLLACASDSTLAQGTKDPSNPVPSMVVPIRPRNEPVGTTAVPNRSTVQQPYAPRLRKIRPANPPPK